MLVSRTASVPNPKFVYSLMKVRLRNSCSEKQQNYKIACVE